MRKTKKIKEESDIQKFLPFSELFTCTECGQHKSIILGKEYTQEEDRMIAAPLIEKIQKDHIKLLSFCGKDRKCNSCKNKEE